MRVLRPPALMNVSLTPFPAKSVQILLITILQRSYLRELFPSRCPLAQAGARRGMAAVACLSVLAVGWVWFVGQAGGAAGEGRGAPGGGVVGLGEQCDDVVEEGTVVDE